MADVPTLLEHNLGDPKKLQEEQQEQDHKALENNPNNDAFWNQRGLKRPDDLDEAIKEGQRILHHEKGHTGQPVTGAGYLYNKAHHEKTVPDQHHHRDRKVGEHV
ncbi:uncharacterized protein ACA1_175880 [Acanthamoeba castellanii str. Neff]|jgi:1,6-anhydro-N-acetylmuramate kinase|uniref:Uncharacterized protein n=1 Tax=Acanthamoeba castellanii (strain ATCC 30010 / Neff) TaxID=1257118 RepID=L8HKH8_ACACF|nr:uncharacterized protein ACA1_175880 [Acanthamoeba castellanii str. Neff]ELR24911.1 hypothetical protein ACA1_175880 [Acanthamoeba castellanii str. Neff]